jgi:hypothetical protein
MGSQRDGYSGDRLRVLVSPLDWGLGHATRVVPLVRTLTALGCGVTLAASDASRVLLAAEFPQLPMLDLPGYRIRYPQKGGHFFGKMVLQLPRILYAVVREHLWLRAAMREHRWDAVVSDNRYGLFHPRARCVILTHQVRIRTGWRVSDRLLRPLLWWVLRRFEACWVPDMPGVPNLAGALCHGRMPEHVRHIGPLSRLEVVPLPQAPCLLILLSGPEPQRTLLEGILRGELADAGLPAVVVRGLPGTGGRRVDGSGVEWLDHVDAAGLQDLLARATLVVARSGYSTVMDLVRTGHPAVFVPTPGQPEQGYLARHLSESGLFPYLAQEGFRLAAALRLAGAFRGSRPAFDYGMHRALVGAWVEDCGVAKRGRGDVG